MTSVVSRSHTFNGSLSGTTRVSRYQKGKPIWILLKQETVSGSGISWAMCKSAPRSRQITMPAPHHSVHHSVFYRPHALPAAQLRASKHWRQSVVGSRPRPAVFSKSNPVCLNHPNPLYLRQWKNHKSDAQMTQCCVDCLYNVFVQCVAIRGTSRNIPFISLSTGHD